MIVFIQYFIIKNEILFLKSSVNLEKFIQFHRNGFYSLNLIYEYQFIFVSFTKQ